MNDVKHFNSSFLRTISPVLSNAMFRRIANEDDTGFIKSRADKYKSYISNTEITTYNDFFNHLYKSLLRDYRNEFVYKNEIVRKIVLGKHSLNTTTIINEFRIGKSIADLVMLNGTSIVYEIKTEYDSTERLLSQINEYRKSFLNVVIVTHYSVVDKYEKFLTKYTLSNIGLLVLSSRNTLNEIRKPIEDSSHLDNTYMFKCLRKEEYLDLINKYFGFSPDVPNTKIFRECLALAKTIEKKYFHKCMFGYLKNRKINEKEILSSSEVPAFLKHISISSNFKKPDVEKVNLFLNKKL